MLLASCYLLKFFTSLFIEVTIIYIYLSWGRLAPEHICIISNLINKCTINSLMSSCEGKKSSFNEWTGRDFPFGDLASHPFLYSGPEGIRTLNPLHAMEVRYRYATGPNIFQIPIFKPQFSLNLQLLNDGLENLL